MRKILFFLFLFFLSFNTVYADRYFQDGNIMDNKYYDTLGFGIDTIEEIRNVLIVLNTMQGILLV